MLLEELKDIKVRKAHGGNVRATMRHDTSKHKSRSKQKRTWKKEIRETVQ